jgi:hypothetical protein
MSSKQSDKGSRFEYKIRDLLTARTGVKWDRVPMSGAGAMKGDIYCLTNHYYYCFECKSFADSVIKENLLTAKSNNFYGWWEQCIREAEVMKRIPGLIFKMDRGKPLIAVTEDIIELQAFSLRTDITGEYIDVHIYLFEDWLAHKDVGDLVVV